MTDEIKPTQHGRPEVPSEAPDMRDYGAAKDGVKQSYDRRLFMQLLVFTGALDIEALELDLARENFECVFYLDLSDPKGVALLTMNEDPSFFTGKLREFILNSSFSELILCPEFTMIGRTYSSGFEQDLEDWLFKKPRRNVFNKELSWHVWYPLRRKGEFELLSKEDQRPVLMEHAKIGMAYGAAGIAHDVRLACHGLDANDNEFLLGIVSKDLGWISKLVQEMRRTQQTSKYIQSMGPFFTGKVQGRYGSKVS